jgi:hypothetical protein
MFNPFKTSLNGTLPTLVATFKFEQVPNIAETWYSSLEMAADHVTETVLVGSGSGLVLNIFLWLFKE